MSDLMCPLLAMGSGRAIPPHYGEGIVTEVAACRRERCAWWTPDDLHNGLGRCAIVALASIADDLRIMADADYEDYEGGPDAE